MRWPLPECAGNAGPVELCGVEVGVVAVVVASVVGVVALGAGEGVLDVLDGRLSMVSQLPPEPEAVSNVEVGVPAAKVDDPMLPAVVAPRAPGPKPNAPAQVRSVTRTAPAVAASRFGLVTFAPWVSPAIVGKFRNALTRGLSFRR